MYPIYRWAFGPLEGMSGISSDRGADQLLDFTHVYDTAQGIVNIYNNQPTNSRIFNISGGVAVRLGDVVGIVRDYLGRDTGVRLGSGNAVNRGAPLDIALAGREVGYKPQFVDIREGIRHYHEWIRSVGFAGRSGQ